MAKRVVALTRENPPGESAHWTGAMMAKAAGISVSSVRRIWRAHGPQPHRVQQFKLSNDPAVRRQAARRVGLCVDPPAHAIIFSLDDRALPARQLSTP